MVSEHQDCGTLKCLPLASYASNHFLLWKLFLKHQICTCSPTFILVEVLFEPAPSSLLERLVRIFHHGLSQEIQRYRRDAAPRSRGLSAVWWPVSTATAAATSISASQSAAVWPTSSV